MTGPYTKPKINPKLEQWFETEGKRLYKQFIIHFYQCWKERNKRC